MVALLVYLNGFILTISITMTLGPQNIFLIRQSSRREYTLLSMIACFVTDCILIGASVIGLHALLESHKKVQQGMAWGGSLFMIIYGVMALKSAVSKRRTETHYNKTSVSPAQIIVLALCFSFLNPNALIDTIVLIGGSSSQYPHHQFTFIFGALSASFVWFSSLAAIAYYFSEFLLREKTWRSMELISGGLMIGMGVRLLLAHLTW